jgi:hypothetical protein
MEKGQDLSRRGDEFKGEAGGGRTKDERFTINWAGNERVMELMEFLTIRYQGNKCKRHWKMKPKQNRFWRMKLNL